MLQTVLRAVAANAIIFNRSERPRVHLRGRRTADTVTISLTGNDIGVAPEHAERAFDLFQRLNSYEDFPGTGTGLALSRRLMALQGGSIDLSSRQSTKTTVTLTLPA